MNPFDPYGDMPEPDMDLSTWLLLLIVIVVVLSIVTVRATVDWLLPPVDPILE